MRLKLVSAVLGIMGTAAAAVSPGRVGFESAPRLLRGDAGPFVPARDLRNRAAKSPRETFYVVRPGDTLQGIALKVYGDPEMWTDVWESNFESLSAAPELWPGRVLRLQSGGVAERHVAASSGTAVPLR